MKLALLLLTAAVLAACGGAIATVTSQPAATSSVTLATTNTIAPTTTTTTNAPTTTLAPSTTAAPTTTTVSPQQIERAQLEADIALIQTLFRSYSDSWFGGTESGYQSLADHNYPGMECTVDDYRTFWGLPEGWTEEFVLHPDTVELHPEWILPNAGVSPAGRIYIHQVTMTYDEPGFDPSAKLQEVHTAIIGGEAFFFVPCRSIG